MGSASLLALIAACGSNPSTSSNQASTTPGPQTYFSVPVGASGYGVFGSNGQVTVQASSSPQTYTIDDQADIFSQTGFGLTTSLPGAQILNAGDVNVVLQRGLRGLSIAAGYAIDNFTTGLFVPYVPPTLSTGLAVELAGQAGGLVQMPGQPVVPIVAATQCPSFASAQTYQFITLPSGLYSGRGTQFDYNWTPTAETAYGSVDIVSSGSAVTFQNIHQHTLPSVGGTGAPSQSGASSATGVCGPTVFGYTTAIPGQLVVTDPGIGSPPPQAIVGIGPSGLLVEYNGAVNGTNIVMPGTTLGYENVLGAGTGAVGLPKPSSDITSAVVGAQYLGFIYGAGVFTSSGASPTGWSSQAASFGGFSTLPANSDCSSFTQSTATPLLYGGDFPNNNPASSSTGYGNCDFAVDLGNPDASNNGLYTQAWVWIGAHYKANTTGNTYKFQAVAIAGQLNGKYATFVLGVDSTRPWAIYLLQSN